MVWRTRWRPYLNRQSRAPVGQVHTAARGPLSARRVRGTTFDLGAVVAALAVVGLGIANLCMVDGAELASRQSAYALAGSMLSWSLSRWRARSLDALGWGCYGLALVLLVAVMFGGTSANGATRWLSVGAFTIQPSELAKLGLLMALAAVLGSARPDWQRFALAMVTALIPIGLILAQPDLSTCALLIALTVSMLILARIPASLLVPLLAAAVVVSPLVIGSLRPYQMQRLGTFLVGSHASAAGSGWAVTQARIAVGSSRLIGPGHDLTALLAQYLPERHTDLALASVVEQFGVLAAAAVLVAALILMWRLALAAKTSRSPPGALVASGLAVLLGVETMVSVGGNLGLLPLAGVPFPLLSYGGSALIVHMGAIGLALGLRRDGVRRRLWAQHGRPRPGGIRTTALAISAIMVIFGIYGWQLHADDGPKLAAQGVDEMTRCSRLPAPRGEITDRHGTPLALSPPDTHADVLAVPGLLARDPAGLTRLAGLLGQPPDTLRRNLRAAPSPALAVPVADVPAAAGATVSDASISGVTVVPRQRRTYPAGALLGSLLGYTGIATPTEQRRWPDLPLGEVVGRSGLEQQYDAVLRGTDGSQCVFVNPLGEPVAAGPRTDPLPGADLRLSIDLGLQRILSDDLAAAMTGQHGRIGAVVALDPRNGQVLALASFPGYDDNVYGPPADTASLSRLAETPGSPMRNHAVQSAVPPGSTFKLVVATANQLHPVWNPNQVVPTGANFSLGGHTFNNWKPMGPMNLAQALAWSNDVYFYKLALALGPDVMIDTARTLGVGAPTGIDLPNESHGYLGTPDTVRKQDATWYPGSTVIMGIGQGYLAVTPLQNARWTAAVATGHLVTPRLGLATGTGNTWAAVPTPPPRLLPFAASLAPVQEGMRAVVTEGTATRFNDLTAPVGAKTGTAQDGSLPDGLYDNWVTADAPAGAPSVVITVLTQGADTATAIGHDALAYYLAHKSEIEQTNPAQGP